MRAKLRNLKFAMKCVLNIVISNAREASTCEKRYEMRATNQYYERERETPLEFMSYYIYIYNKFVRFAVL